jgi:seryl-tRNA synthetase
MIDIDIIRKTPEKLDAGLQKRGLAGQAVELAKLDEARRAIQTKQQELQAERNALSATIGDLKKNKQSADAEMAHVLALKTELEGLSAEEEKRGTTLTERLASIPNIPADDVLVGADEKDNKVEKTWGDEFKPRLNDAKEHHQLGEALGMMSAARAASMSGTRFTWLERGLARMERALANLFLDVHTTQFGYTEVSPPLLVRANAMFGTGQLPKFEEDLFKTNTDHYLVPTAEVPLTNYVAGEIVDIAQLPLRFTALTPCFRSEAGSAGRDTVGMLRQHQFYKVELVSITAPEQSDDEHERMVRAAETVLEMLKLPYRRMLLCTGDMGFASRKTYDLEVWLPGQGQYREISSCSNCGDFQARRMNARCRAAGEKSTQFVHTLNGSGVAVGRALIAVMENYQQADGRIAVPDVLQPYMNGLKVIEP